eukprot:CAMPEP_0171178040 /NCGR_PEP_ID=MMETSP0790-20130122/12549_1 /TAXON_ID=2925 /ORGANISM="Alexandrium catenella, Strain OF101" /LENGTH=355 /DNA_ID=CAMNT_0011642955 /DNA_START=49 /DNA_END=1112 /DNA_ORIENTATION=-
MTLVVRTGRAFGPASTVRAARGQLTVVRRSLSIKPSARGLQDTRDDLRTPDVQRLQHAAGSGLWVEAVRGHGSSPWPAAVLHQPRAHGLPHVRGLLGAPEVQRLQGQGAVPSAPADPALEEEPAEGHGDGSLGAAWDADGHLGDQPAADAAAQVGGESEEEGGRPALLCSIHAAALRRPRAEADPPGHHLGPGIPALLAVPEAREVVLPRHALHGDPAALLAHAAQALGDACHLGLLVPRQPRHEPGGVPLVVEVAGAQVVIQVGLEHAVRHVHGHAQAEPGQRLHARARHRVAAEDLAVGLLLQAPDDRRLRLQERRPLQAAAVPRQHQQRREALREEGLAQAAEQPLRRQGLQ